ncbi:MAG TPA: hypothetical protein VHD81_06930 [Mycobacteriales bacterium]|nr:hypothetical protein [Mycobacteriales bacterium]
MKRIGAALLMSSLVVAGCSSGSKPTGTSAYTLASRACQTSGQAAADLAAQAAAIDSKYAQLAADEKAVASSQAAQQSGSEDQDLSGLTTGQAASAQVLADCANMARALIPGSNQ